MQSDYLFKDGEKVESQCSSMRDRVPTEWNVSKGEIRDGQKAEKLLRTGTAGGGKVESLEGRARGPNLK